MIRAVVGVPGSGKSLFLVERAQYYLKQGRPVYSNFPIKGCLEFGLDDLIKFAFPEDSVVIIDEAGRLFNARNWKDLPSEVFDLFTMHRHLNVEMYIGVQAFNRIDTSLREVIEVTYVAQKGWFRHYYRGYYEVQRVGKIKGTEDLFCSIWFPSRLYKYYDTFAMKAVWQDKEMIPERPYQPLPLTRRQKIKKYFTNKLINIIRHIRPTYAMNTVELEEYMVIQQREEIYQDWLNDLSYLDRLDVQNNGFMEWYQRQDDTVQHYTRRILYFMDWENE